MSRKDRHFQGIMREIRNFSKTIISESFPLSSNPCFFGFPCFFHLQGSPCFFWRFALLSHEFQGFGGEKSPFFWVVFLVFFSEKAKEDQGFRK